MLANLAEEQRVVNEYLPRLGGAYDTSWNRNTWLRMTA